MGISEERKETIELALSILRKSLIDTGTSWHCREIRLYFWN